MQKYTNNVQDTTGKAVVGAAITVNLPSGGLATIYSDNGVTQTTNPIYSSLTGSFAFYAADGRYNIVITYGNNTVTLNDVIIEDSQDTLTFVDTGNLATFQSTTNSYNQIGIQNKSNGAVASSSYIANNDQGTASTNFVEMGINSSGFTGSGSFSQAGYGYIASASTDLAVGTYGNSPIHFVINNSATDAALIDTSGNLKINPSLATPAGGSAVGLRLGSVGLGVFFGSGVPTISAPQGSLYMRTDGSSTSTRVYVNTNGTTGWTNLVTAA